MEHHQLRVAQAVHVLNHDLQSRNRLAAHQWLLEFQNSDAAWEIVSSLLTSDRSILEDFELEFFAAHILKQKILNEGHTLESGAKDALLNALLLAARKFGLGPPQLLTQICLALSALILRVSEHTKPIEQLFSSLDKLQTQENGTIAVLEMLTVLPEEVFDGQRFDSSISSARRREYGQELLSRAPTVLQFLLHQSQLSLSNDPLYERNRKILRCLLSWVRIGCFLELPPSSLTTHPILSYIFNSLQVLSLFDLSVEVLIELVNRHEVLPQVLLFRVQFLKEILLDPALTNREEKVIIGLASLMSEIGQAVPALIAEASKEALVLVDSLLSCVAFPSEEWKITEPTLPFWEILAVHILGLDKNDTDNIRIMEDAFFPVFSALLDALLLHAQVAEASIIDNRGTFEMPDDLVNFRTNLENLLAYICQIVGSSIYIQKVFNGWDVTDTPMPWIIVESRLFALNRAAEIILLDQHPFDFSMVIRLVSLLSSMKHNGFKGFMSFVYKAVAELICSYSRWLSAVQSNTRQLLLFCAAGIADPLCSTACSSALYKLCEDASSIFHDPSILEILVWIGEGLSKRHLPLKEEEEVVSAISLILISCPNKEIKNELLSRLLSSSCGAIENIIDPDSENYLKQNPTVLAQALSFAERGLYRFGTVFSHFASSDSSDDTIVALLGVFWPLLEKLFISEHIKNSCLCTAACRSLSQAVESSGQHFLIILPKVVNCLSTNFLSFQHHECYLRTAALVIEEFGEKEEFGPLFITTLEKITSATSIKALNSTYLCNQDPHLVEAYTNFTTTFVQCCPKEIVASAGPVLEVSFQKACICFPATHRGAALSAMSYVSSLLDVALVSMMRLMTGITEGSLSAIVIQILSRCGEVLISNILCALLGVSAMSRVHKSVIILQKVAAICSVSERTTWKEVLCWNSLHRWFHSTVVSLEDGYLRPGEADSLVTTWLEALMNSATEYLLQNYDPMHGKGGKALKHMIRDFVDTHR